MDRLTLTHVRKCIEEYGSAILMCGSRLLYFKNAVPEAKVMLVSSSYKGINSPIIVTECAFNLMDTNMVGDIEAHNDKFIKKFERGRNELCDM